MIFTAGEIEGFFRRGEARRIGMGAHRSCWALGDSGYCLKGARTEEEIAEGRMCAGGGNVPLSPSLVERIRRRRFDERLNTCVLEVRLHAELAKTLPPDVFEAFPERMETVFLQDRGWCAVESLIDGVESFRNTYKASDAGVRAALVAEFRRLVEGLASHGVRFYDPQNILVQKAPERPSGFRLRIVDFEPVSGTVIHLDAVFPFLVGMKVRRRALRYLREHFGI